MTDKTTDTGILPAIAAAMGEVQKVGKAARNPQGGYQFASVDDFLALVNPICARHGLIVLADEGDIEDFERSGQKGPSSWMRVRFMFTVRHISGEEIGPIARTVEVLRNGAQAYGSAQSYALKQFLRGLLLIPTGDKDDADFRPTDDGPVQRRAPRQDRREPPQADAPPFMPEAARDRIMERLHAARTLAALRETWQREKDVLAELKAHSEPMFLQLETLKNERRDALTPNDPAMQGPPDNGDLLNALPY